jgi:capsular polysaccharide biosynthesis protein
VTDPVIFSLDGGSGEPDRLGGYDDFAAPENRPADSGPGLVSLGFITAAVRRRARFVLVMAIVGLLVGVGAYKRSPHQYQATAWLLLTLTPYENALTAVNDDPAIAKTSGVAAIALHELGLHQSVSSFLSTFSAASVTSRVLTITVSAPSADQAVVRAGDVGTAFLKFRADEQIAQQNLVVASLNQQVNQAKQRANSIDAQISQLASQPSPQLQAEQKNATTMLDGLEQAVTGNQANTLPAMTAALKNSTVLSVFPVPHSAKKKLITYGAVGLLVGLTLGLTIVIVRALASDRLRRRDDIAYALDAPVKLSVGPLRARRLLPAWPGRAAKRNLDRKRIVVHLRSAVPRNTPGLAGLAIVAVDNAPVVARAVADLGASYASQGNQVVTADLSGGAELARLLGVRSPGAHPVSHNGTNFTMAVPDRYDLAPVGPLPPVTSAAEPAKPADALVAACASADLLFTLVTLDPALGGDHLATWAPNAVVVVTAGESSGEKIHGVGEMIRLAGTRLDSVVLIGADERDESLGLMRRPEEQAGIGVLGR